MMRIGFSPEFFCDQICRALHILHQQRIDGAAQITEEILFDLFLPGPHPVPDQAGDDGIDAEPVRNCTKSARFAETTQRSFFA